MIVTMVEVVHCFGTVVVEHKSVAKLRKGEFDNNRANGSGGALFNVILANVTIESSRFLMNSATKKGGVVYIAQHLLLKLE